MGIGFPEAAIIIIVIGIITFEVCMLFAIVRDRQLGDLAKLLWIAAVLILHPIGALAYYILQYSGRGSIRRIKQTA